MDAMMIYMPIIMSILGLIYVFIRRSWVLKQDSGDGKMKEISDHIYEGALAFLNAEYRLLSVFVLHRIAICSRTTECQLMELQHVKSAGNTIRVMQCLRSSSNSRALERAAGRCAASVSCLRTPPCCITLLVSCYC